MGECTCDGGEREVVETVPWQRDFCNACGYPIPETTTARHDS